jgi:hypothetical protein
MRRVLKFVVPPARVTEIETADEPLLLHVDWQERDLCIWVEATAGEGVKTRLGAVMTGEYLPDGQQEHVGSAQTVMDGMRIVAHVYRWLA